LLLLPAAALNPAGSAGRRCLGIAYVFRLAANNNSCALIFPNHFGSGIDRSRFGNQNGFDLIKINLQVVINWVETRSNNKSDTLDSGES
jgi:hypothetical protein